MPYFSPFRDDHSKKCCNIHTATTITISLWGLTRNAARMILVTFSLTDSWRMSDRTGMILYRRRCSHIWGLNARSHIEKIIWYWSWKPHLLLKTPIMLKKNRGGGKKIFHTSTSKKKWNMLTLKEQVSELSSASSLAATALNSANAQPDHNSLGPSSSLEGMGPWEAGAPLQGNCEKGCQGLKREGYRQNQQGVLTK